MLSDQSLQRNQNETPILFLFFSIWSFFILCRPQDYIYFIEVIRPVFVLSLLTLVIYIFSTKTTSDLSGSNQFRLYTLFIIILIAGIPFSLYRSATLKSVLFYIAVSSMFFVLFFQLVNTATKILRLVFAYCFGVSVYALYTLRYGDFIEKRISFGSMFDPNDIAFFVISLLPFNLLFISKGNGIKRVFVSLNIIIGLLLILKTGSRGGLIACATVFLYLVFVKTKTVNMSFFKKALLVFLAAASLLSFSVYSERYKAIVDIKHDYNITGETGRISIWKIGMRMMLENPLTGVGMSCFNEGVGRDRERRGVALKKWQAPHNSLIQVGAETGVIGLVLFSLMSFRVFSISGKVASQSKSEDLVRISEMARVGFLGHFVSGMFLSQAYSVYWIFYVVLSATLHRMLLKERS